MPTSSLYVGCSINNVCKSPFTTLSFVQGSDVILAPPEDCCGCFPAIGIIFFNSNFAVCNNLNNHNQNHKNIYDNYL